MGRVLHQSYHCLCSIAILFLTVWTCGTCCQHEMMWPIGDFLNRDGSPIPVPLHRGRPLLPTTVLLFSSLPPSAPLLSLSLSLFKEPIVEPFCLGNATIVGASLETKTRPYHLSDRKRWTRACVREKEKRESCGNERKEHP